MRGVLINAHLISVVELHSVLEPKLATVYASSVTHTRSTEKERREEGSEMAKQTSLRFNNRVGLVVLLALAFLVLLFLLYNGRGGPDYVDETIKISELLAAAVQLAEAGGDKIVEIRKMDDKQIGQLTKGLTKEGRDEYVTLGDQMSHQIITSGFRRLWPHLKFRSEEKDHQMAKRSSFHFDLMDPEISAVVRRDEAVAMDQVCLLLFYLYIFSL